jgi:osmotically-inducible protein OsmY
MNGLMKVATVFAAGAAAMYFLDPDAGRRRRATTRDKGMAAGRDLQENARQAGRRVSDRAHGAVSEMGAAMDSAMDDAPVSDQKLEARIRSQLGHMVERPGDIAVEVNDGHVVLSGTASDDEVASLTRELAGMSGVSDVENRMH